MIPVLPLDIIGNIVDILVNDNEKGFQCVKALSLTCKFFLPLCRKHIFSSITITTSNALVGWRSGKAFGELLSTTPEIAGHVRKLRIRPYDPRSVPRHPFVQVPRQLTRLESLTILEHGTFYHTHGDWKCIPLSMRHLLLDFIHIPTLNHLDLRSLRNFPISHLMASPNLKHLSTTNLFLVDEGDADATALAPFKPIKLRALDIAIRGLSWDILNVSSPTLFLATIHTGTWPILDLTGLEKISVEFFHTFLTIPLRQVFQKARQLTDIHILVDDLCFQALKLAKTITPCIQTLTRVHLVIASDRPSVPTSVMCPLSDLCDELEDIAGKNKLDSLKIELHMDRKEYAILDDQQLRRLEKIILRSGWPMLKHISLDLVVYNLSLPYDSSFEMGLEKLRRTQFTRLKSSKTIDFRFSVRCTGKKISPRTY
ncbi:hypothetical protein BYT27DRAFT_7147106 [Phlegmacium glaucopus]|nr:hypothetical protein BYT27DRAFT_7147106 [Phlegmacium glaucopus]